MREYLTPHTIASTIRMLRSTAATLSFLIVEGDTDARLLKRFLDQRLCHVQVAYKRDYVLGVVTILDADGFVGHLGLIDKDFADMLGEETDKRNVITTEENDIEVMIFRTQVFERFLAEYCNDHKIKILESRKSAPLRDILVNSAASIGTIRYLSRRQQWNIDFQEMTYRFKKRNDVEVDIARQIEHLRGRSRSSPMPPTPDVLRIGLT